MNNSDDFVIFLLILPLLAYVLFWIFTLAKIMQKDPDELPGQHDKWLWILIYIFFAPLAPLVVVAYFLTAPKRTATRQHAPSTDTSRADVYREQIKKLRRENRTLKNQLADADGDADNDDDLKQDESAPETDNDTDRPPPTTPQGPPNSEA